jgi:ankyrin repeat protein
MDSPGGKEIIASGEAGDIVAAAARTGQVEILDLLLHAGVDVANVVELAGSSSALHWASRCGHIRVASWLIQQKADLDPVDIYGRPLHYAAYYGHVEVLTFLISSKVSVDGGVVYEKPRPDADEAVSGALAKKHGVNGVKNAMRRCGDQPGDWDAFEAVRPKPFAGSGKLKDSSSLQLAQKRTPLHLASAQGHIAAVVALLRANANANIIDKWGLDAFTYAEAAGHKTVAVQVAQAAATALEGSSSEEDNSDVETNWKPEPEPEMAPA